MSEGPSILEMARDVEHDPRSVFGGLDGEGNLHPVGGIIKKLIAAADETAKVGGLSVVVVSDDQTEIDAELLDPKQWPLHVIKATSLDHAFERLYQDHGPRGAWRRRQEEECARLRLLNREVPLELGEGELYQLPRLHQVERVAAREERAGLASGDDERDERGHERQDFRGGAEEVRNGAPPSGRSRSMSCSRIPVR